MKAAVMRMPGEPLTIEDIDIDEPKAGEVKVRLTAVGLCHTDVSAFHGSVPIPFPAVLGHEGVGVVEEVGEQVTMVKPGEKVLLSAFVYCGRCPYCAKGLLGACPDSVSLSFGGSMKDGTTRLSKGDETIYHFFCQSSFAEYCIADEEFVIKVPEDIPLEKIAALCCGGSTGIGAVLNKAKVWPGAKVAVLGCGGVGTSAIMAAKLCGATMIVAVDVLDSKLETAKSFGATHLVNASRENPIEKIQLLTYGGVDFSIEAIGKSETMAQALDIIRAGGTAVVVGAASLGVTAPIDAINLLVERTICGSLLGSMIPRFDIPRYIELYRAGLLPVDKLIQAEYPLERINEAITDFEEGKFIKAVIRP